MGQTTSARYKEGTTVASETGIRASGGTVVETSANVKYYAPQIELDAVFRVELGGMFQVITEAVDCNTFSP